MKERMWEMSQTAGVAWRVQRGKSFKESLKKREGSKVRNVFNIHVFKNA